MNNQTLLIGVLIACLTAPAGAQTEPLLPALETLNCEQMQAEMTSAGQLMNQQIDPNLGTEIEAMQENSRQRMQAAQAGAVGAGIICSIPGMGMACTAAMNAQVAEQMSHADEDRARMDAMVGGMQNAIAGIDQERMTAISQRWESEDCQAPQPLLGDNIDDAGPRHLDPVLDAAR